MSSSPDAGTTGALDLLRGRPNPFDGLVRPQRSDDRFTDLHSPTLLHEPRELLLRIIDAYRLTAYRGAADLPDTRVVTILGPRGAGKTHMLEAVVRRADGKPQLLIRPTYYETQVGFEDYLLAHLVNALLAEDPIHGGKPFLDVAVQLTRRLLRQALRELGPTDRLFACVPSRRQGLRLLWGGGEVFAVRVERFITALGDRSAPRDLPELARQHHFTPELLLRFIEAHLHRHENSDEALSAIRRQLYQAMARAALLRDGDALSRFLETEHAPPNARPYFRGEVVRQVLHALVEACALVQLPVVFAFDNLEGILAPQSHYDPVVTQAFMDSLAQAVDATRGLLFLLFAETTLHRKAMADTHQFALDRLRQGVPLYMQGPVDLIELRPPGFDELRPLITERVARLLRDLPTAGPLPAAFPFSQTFLDNLAEKRDMGLRNKLLALRDEYSRVVYGRTLSAIVETKPAAPDWNAILERAWTEKLAVADRKLPDAVSQLQALHAGLGRLLQHAGPMELNGWRLGEVQAAVNVGENAVQGRITLIDWQPVAQPAGNGSSPRVRIGIGLLLSKGSGLPPALRAKFDLFQEKALQADELVVLWPRTADGDLVEALPEATRQVWKSARKRSHAALRSLTDDDLRKMLACPEWLDAVQSTTEQPVPLELLRAFVWQRCQSLFQLTLPLAPERSLSHAD